MTSLDLVFTNCGEALTFFPARRLTCSRRYGTVIGNGYRQHHFLCARFLEFSRLVDALILLHASPPSFLESGLRGSFSALFACSEPRTFSRTGRPFVERCRIVREVCRTISRSGVVYWVTLLAQTEMKACFLTSAITLALFTLGEAATCGAGNNCPEDLPCCSR